MIVKGKSRPVAGTLARYIVQKKQNGFVSVQEIHGTISQDVAGALQEMEAIAEGTNCKSFLYHASINPQEHEHLTPEQWQRAVEILEKELKLEGHQRVLVEHIKDGRAHYHCIWNRVDPDTLKAVHMSGSYAAHERAARQMEREFGLERIQGVHAERDQGEIPERGPKSSEMERGKRSGFDPRQITAEVSELWKGSKNGKEFMAALEERGYLLARGDKCDFLLLDPAGDHHSVARRTKAKAADVRAKLADIERETLPGLDQARAIQKERFDQRGKVMAERERVMKEEEERKKAYRLEEEQRNKYFQGEEERRQQYFREEEIKQQAFKAQAERQEALAREMQEQEHRLNSYRAGLARQAEESRREEQQRRQADNERRAREGEIRNAQYRYGQALGRHYNIKDPYGSLARSAMEEYRMFLQDRETLDRKIAKAEDPKERQALELRKRIEAAEYMAITSNRIAGQSQVIGGNNYKENVAREQARAEAFQKEAATLREQLRELHGAREHGGDGRTSMEAPRTESTNAPQATAHEPKNTRKVYGVRRANHGHLKTQHQNTDAVKAKEEELQKQPKDNAPRPEPQPQAQTHREEPRRDPVQQKKAEHAARTEQTEAKRAKTGKELALENLARREARQGRGRDDDDRERERER